MFAYLIASGYGDMYDSSITFTTLITNDVFNFIVAAKFIIGLIAQIMTICNGSGAVCRYTDKGHIDIIRTEII